MTSPSRDTVQPSYCVVSIGIFCEINTMRCLVDACLPGAFVILGVENALPSGESSSNK